MLLFQSPPPFFFFLFLGAILRKQKAPRQNTQNVGVTFISQAQIVYLKDAGLGEKSLERQSGCISGRTAFFLFSRQSETARERTSVISFSLFVDVDFHSLIRFVALLRNSAVKDDLKAILQRH